jgi:propionate CoA-transferase
VDCVVIARPELHAQTFGEPSNPAYSGEVRAPRGRIPPLPLTPRKVIARRAAQFLSINPEANICYANFEGLNLVTEDDVARLSAFLDGFFQSLGRCVNVIVNYDNFNLNPAATDAFYAMVRRNTERYFLSSTRYSTNAFFRRLLGARLEGIDMPQPVYRNYAEAREAPG